MCSLLVHKHSWIRLASGRLLGMYYVACGENNHGDSSSKASFWSAFDSSLIASLGPGETCFGASCSNDMVLVIRGAIFFHVV